MDLHNKDSKLTKKSILRVADMFCGGGGISEGLRQAGMEVVYGLDSNASAIETFRNNHPNALAIKTKIEDLNTDSIPEFDVLVGGPPCVEFSASKQGRGNILEGLKLVQAFLRLVHEKKPRYWIMENVPKIVLHLPEKIPLNWIGIDEDGFLDVPVRSHFHVAEFGVPQARERFLMGNFPIPETTHFNAEAGMLLGLAEGKREWVNLQKVLDSLPSPLESRPDDAVKVKDVNYELSIDCAELTDHFHEVELSESEARGLRKAKESHPFMGWMPFPDKTNRPARTVVATQLGRETLIIGETINGKARFRRATVRECAVLQGYPITYQFFGPSLNARYKIVGNSVPPLFTYYIGREIQEAEERPFPNSPKVCRTPYKLSEPILKQQVRRRPNYSITRKFAELVPGKEVRGCRVELTNMGDSPGTTNYGHKKVKHVVEWRCRLSIGEGKANLRQAFLSENECRNLVEQLKADRKTVNLMTAVNSKFEQNVVPILTDATTLQAAWAQKLSNAVHPEEVVDRISDVVDSIFPPENYRDILLSPDHMLDFLPRKGLRIRLAIAALLTARCCSYLNQGVYPSSAAEQFVPEHWAAGKVSV